ncbi:M67 family metallopeptidase [Cyanobium sp. Aljojuca 7D2]|nr:M67 family metallopeptidase [Cyanobium sp. Aljojuca 7D2]
MQLRAGHRLLTVLRQILACAGPEEGCALLLGQRLGDGWRLDWVWPCCNVWPVPNERCRHFAIDPREQLLAQKWGRQRGLELLGSAHSHPTSEAVPSASDCRLSALPALMVILGAGSQHQTPEQDQELVAWWLPEPPAQPQRLPWRMES